MKRTWTGILVLALLWQVWVTPAWANTESLRISNVKLDTAIIDYSDYRAPVRANVSFEATKDFEGELDVINHQGAVVAATIFTGYANDISINGVATRTLDNQDLALGEYSLKLKLHDLQGNEQVVDAGTITVIKSEVPLLIQNGHISAPVIYPQPDSQEPLTTFSFDLARKSSVWFSLAKKGDELNYHYTYFAIMEPGKHSITWNGRDNNGTLFPDGTYSIVLDTHDQQRYYGQEHIFQPKTWEDAAWQITVKGVPPVPKNPGKKLDLPFTDIAEHWALDPIFRMAGAGIVSGYPDATFRPDNLVTRTEAVVMLGRVLHLEQGSEDQLNFTDSAQIPSWARGMVAAMVSKGLISGYPQADGKFKFLGDQPVSRLEVAVLMARILEQNLGTISPPNGSFADVAKISPWGRHAADVVRKENLMKGYPDWTFRPENKITRAELTQVVWRLTDLV